MSGEQTINFPDNQTMHIGCRIYGFKSQETAFHACDIWAGNYKAGENNIFESYLRNQGIEFEVISDNCGLTS